MTTHGDMARWLWWEGHGITWLWTEGANVIDKRDRIIDGQETGE